MKTSPQFDDDGGIKSEAKGEMAESTVALAHAHRRVTPSTVD